MSVFVIGEPGSTPCGKLDMLQRALETAAKAGADAVKFQFVSSPERLAQRRGAKEYLSAYELIKFPEKRERVWNILRRDADDLGLKIGCSVYLPEDVKPLSEDFDFLKVSSFEAGALDIHDEIRDTRYKKPVYVSVGLIDGDEIRDLRRMLYRNTEVGYKYLHCVSVYPAPWGAMQLGLLNRSWCHGLSDHSRNLITGAVATGAGAQAIETHYRADDLTSTNSPDYEVSFNQDEYTEYIYNIRQAEQLMGEVGQKVLGKSESDMRKYRVCN